MVQVHIRVQTRMCSNLNVYLNSTHTTCMNILRIWRCSYARCAPAIYMVTCVTHLKTRRSTHLWNLHHKNHDKTWRRLFAFSASYISTYTHTHIHTHTQACTHTRTHEHQHTRTLTHVAVCLNFRHATFTHRFICTKFCIHSLACVHI